MHTNLNEKENFAQNRSLASPKALEAVYVLSWNDLLNASWIIQAKSHTFVTMTRNLNALKQFELCVSITVTKNFSCFRLNSQHVSFLSSTHQHHCIGKSLSLSSSEKWYGLTCFHLSRWTVQKSSEFEKACIRQHFKPPTQPSCIRWKALILQGQKQKKLPRLRRKCMRASFLTLFTVAKIRMRFFSFSRQGIFVEFRRVFQSTACLTFI